MCLRNTIENLLLTDHYREKNEYRYCLNTCTKYFSLFTIYDNWYLCCTSFLHPLSTHRYLCPCIHILDRSHLFLPQTFLWSLPLWTKKTSFLVPYLSSALNHIHFKPFTVFSPPQVLLRRFIEALLHSVAVCKENGLVNFNLPTWYSFFHKDHITNDTSSHFFTW